MTTLSFPDVGPPARLRWRLISNTQVGLSPLSKSAQTYELPGARWGFTAEWPPLDNVSQAARRRALMRAFLAQLGGQAGRFTVHNWEAPNSAGTPNTPTGDTANLTFFLPLADAGNGAVDTTPLVHGGSGTATFTRAGAGATTILSNGNIANVSANIARSCYSPSGTYLGYLAEGARTNTCLQSENFGTTWSAIGTPTRSAAAVTLGTLVLDLLGDDDAGAVEGYGQVVTLTGDAVKAVSVFIKKGTSTSTVIELRDTTAGVNRLQAVITWSGTVPVVTMVAGTDLTGTPEQHGSSGVYRLRFASTTATAANSNQIRVFPATNSAGLVTSTGDVYVGGSMVEDALFPGTYIPTTTAAVTRNADVLTYASAGNVSDTAGTSYAEFLMLGNWNSNQAVLSRDGNGRFPYMNTSINVATMYDGTTSFTSNASTTALNNVVKNASSWGGNGQRDSYNGTAVASAAFDGTMGSGALAIGCFNTGTAQLFGTIRNVRIFSTQLSDANLQALPASDPAVYAASQTGKSLTTCNWTPSVTGIVKAGDFFSVNGELKMLTADANSDASGNATLSFVPALRASPAVGALLDFSSPQGTFMLSGDTVEWSVDEGNLFGEYMIDAVEVF